MESSSPVVPTEITRSPPVDRGKIVRLEPVEGRSGESRGDDRNGNHLHCASLVVGSDDAMMMSVPEPIWANAVDEPSTSDAIIAFCNIDIVWAN